MILNLTLKYQPQNREETFDIMNMLDERFKHPNHAIVLGAINIFLKVTQ